MSTETEQENLSEVKDDANILWCNFCDLRTTDQKAYLSHSCTEELERRGVAVVATGLNECR